jgi:hypothetical protein
VVLGLRVADQGVCTLLEVAAFGQVAGEFGRFLVERNGLLGVAVPDRANRGRAPSR